MGAVQELHDVCRRNGLTFALVLLDATSHRVRSEPIYPYGSLAFRVLHEQRGIAVGRCQSDPGRESLDELAASCIALLERRGLR